MSEFDYTSPRWKKLRARVLREAGYRCEWSRRFGKNVEATRVHHIWPAEDWPQFAEHLKSIAPSIPDSAELQIFTDKGRSEPR